MRWRPTGDNNSETEGIFLAELQSFLASELIDLYGALWGSSHVSAYAGRTAALGRARPLLMRNQADFSLYVHI